MNSEHFLVGTYTRNPGHGPASAGIYRLSKGVPAEMWPELTVMENKPDANNPKLRQLVIGYKATPVMNMAALQKDDGKWALVYIQFKQWPEQLKKLMQTK